MRPRGRPWIASRPRAFTPEVPEAHVLEGWGEAVRAPARVLRPASVEEVAAALRAAAEQGRTLCLRGAGRSYGDAALGRDVLDLTRLRRVRAFDQDLGRITVEAGVTIEDLWRAVLPSGWWPKVVPGTMYPTVGGCVAMNVHGKNHFRKGAFGDAVEALELVLPSGEVREVTPEADPELFAGLLGGMGLLGVVTAATLRLERVHSGLLEVTARALPSLAGVHEEFRAREASADYLVGWVDAFHSAGRGVVHSARYLAPAEDPHPERTLAGQDLPARIGGLLPRNLVPALLGPFARPAGIRAVNAAKYLATRVRTPHVFRQPHVQFAFLLDYVPDWKRIYRPGGLVQHQSFVPREQALAVHGDLLQRCRAAGIVPWLAVYKRHVPGRSLLSHAVDGYSLALDLPVTRANRERLWALCAELDRTVLDAGGRFYFAKDLTAAPETLERAYPELSRFRALRRRIDPAGRLTNDLAQRLRL